MAKVRMAILGCGGMAGAHALRFKQDSDVEIVALCDVSEEGVQAFIDRNLSGYEPEPAIYTNAADMYSEIRPDAVTIVTPHTMHFEHGVQALRAGCHVLMEKPMVTDSGQAHELAKVVEETGLILVIGYNTPCTPAFQQLRDIIRTKELGKLEVVSGWLAQDWKRLTTGLWRQDPSLSGGGQMYDSGAHLFNSLVWTIEQQISEVHAFVDNVGTPVDINGTANIKFADGVLATIMISGNCSGSGAGMTFCFEDGLVEIDGWSGSWIKISRRDGNNSSMEPTGVEPETPNQNFVKAVLGRAEPQTSVKNGIIQSELMDAIYESARTGQVARPKAR